MNTDKICSFCTQNICSVPGSEIVDRLFETTAEVGVVVLEGDRVGGELTKISFPLGLLRCSKAGATGGKIRGDLVYG